MPRIRNLSKRSNLAANKHIERMLPIAHVPYKLLLRVSHHPKLIRPVRHNRPQLIEQLVANLPVLLLLLVALVLLLEEAKTLFVPRLALQRVRVDKITVSVLWHHLFNRFRSDPLFVRGSQSCRRGRGRSSPIAHEIPVQIQADGPGQRGSNHSPQKRFAHHS